VPEAHLQGSPHITRCWGAARSTRGPPPPPILVATRGRRPRPSLVCCHTRPPLPQPRSPPLAASPTHLLHHGLAVLVEEVPGGGWAHAGQPATRCCSQRGPSARVHATQRVLSPARPKLRHPRRAPHPSAAPRVQGHPQPLAIVPHRRPSPPHTRPPSGAPCGDVQRRARQLQAELHVVHARREVQHVALHARRGTPRARKRNTRLQARAWCRAWPGIAGLAGARPAESSTPLGRGSGGCACV
jgi:hypothetical protein